MLRFLLTVSIAALTSACASTPAPVPSSDFIAAIAIPEPPAPSIIEAPPKPLPVPEQIQPVTTKISSPPAPSAKPAGKAPTPKDAIKKGRESALIEPSVDGYVNAIQVYPYTEGSLYRLYASPGQVSDIALQPGETLVSVSAGDTVRWVVGDTSSGSGDTARVHVLVKPVSAGLRTNLMIATDRRTYHLELESVASGYMTALSWRYPADELAGLVTRKIEQKTRETNSITPELALDTLNFDYRLSGDTPDWKPVRVFDDGTRVFIQMPDTAADMPPLFVVSDSGKAELVNYRVRGNYYIVDRLFRAAELRLGTKKQTIVRITRGATRKGLARLLEGPSS